MDNSFQLDPSEHERVYEETIEPTIFLDTTPVDKPKITIIGGQTGAGKNNLVEFSINEFSDSNAVTVNTDDLRSFHPQFEEIVALDDTRSAERTHEDASSWNQKLLSRCIETRRNILLEGVFKNGKKLVGLVETLKKNGYEVTIRIVAAHERYSVWGINRRYEEEKIVRGHGRYVPIDYHDECYRKLLDTMDLVEEQKAADRIEVYNRNGERVYSNALIGGKWKEKPSASSAIEKERNRKLSEKERAEYVDSWQRVFEYMEKRGASSDEIARVKALAVSFIDELNRNS